MANPNILALSSVTGKSNTAQITTGGVTILSGSAGTVLKVNTLMIGNMDGVTAYGVTMNYNNGITSVTVANNISVPAQSTLTIIDKTATFYMEENHTIVLYASQNNKLNSIISYEIMS